MFFTRGPCLSCVDLVTLDSTHPHPHTEPLPPPHPVLEYESREVALLGELPDSGLYLRCIEYNLLSCAFRGGERELLAETLHDSMQPTRANVLHVTVDLRRELGHLPLGLVCELELDALGEHESALLLDEVILRLRQNGVHVLFRERLELDANRHPTLKLREQI